MTRSTCGPLDVQNEIMGQKRYLKKQWQNLAKYGMMCSFLFKL